MNAHELKKRIRELDDALRRNAAKIAHPSSDYRPEIAVEAYRIAREASRLRLDNTGEPAAWSLWERGNEHMRVARALELPVDFEAGLDALREGDTSVAEPVIRYIEADPWFPGSGYLKERAIHRLKSVSLTDDHAARLRTVILQVTRDSGGRREWSRYARLAVTVDSLQLRADLIALAQSADCGARRRALWIIDVLERRDPRQRHRSWYLTEAEELLRRCQVSGT